MVGPITTAGSRRPHLPAIDVVRAVTVLTVISVHSLSVLIPEDPGAAGVVLTVFHSSREVFLLLSAMVLTWSLGDRPVRPWAFWRRRAPLVVGPYVLWSVVYFVSGGSTGGLARLGLDLTDAGAHYHLYFLLLTLQLYLVMPVVLPWLRARAARPWVVVAASAALQVAFTAAVHWQVTLPPPVSWLAGHPGTWLFSYQLYVVAGVMVGLHAEKVSLWCAHHVPALLVAAGATVAAAVAGYGMEVLAGWAPVRASGVFQPAVTVTAVVIGALELGVGYRVTARASSTTLRRLLACSDLSFGVYLLHPLLLQVLQEWSMTGRLLASLPPAVAVGVVVLVVVPVVGAVAAAAVHGLRSTPLSVVTTGRPRRSAPLLAPAGAGPAVVPAADSTLPAGQ
jgi:peptidoglycan/LPS O-acetylase OafA/YrhL